MTAFEKLEDFFSKYKLFRYQKGEAILRPGDTPQGVYLIKKGYVRLYSISENGEELTLIIFKPNDFFPLMWAINNTENTEYLEAMTSVEIWRSPKDKFLEFIKTNPDVFFELTSRILVRLGGLLERMQYLVFGSAYEKVASILLICVERFGKKEGKHTVIQVPLTHSDIARLIGVARETASIEMKKMERKRLIAYRGRLLIVKNKRRLEKEAFLEGIFST